MKALTTAVAVLGLALLPGPAFTAQPTHGAMGASGTPVRVVINGIPKGATRAVLFFSGIVGNVTMVKVMNGPPGTTARPINVPGGKGFGLTFRLALPALSSATVCFKPTAPSHAAFARGTFTFAPSQVVRPIRASQVRVEDCLE